MKKIIEDCISDCCSAPLNGEKGNYICSDCKESCEAQTIETDTDKNMETEKEFLEYLVRCCENILGKQIEGIGYPAAEKYGFTPPILQLMKMNAELKVRIENLKQNAKIQAS